MKKKVVYLKAPANIQQRNRFLTPGKLYRVEETEAFREKCFFMKNNKNADLYVSETDAELYGWEPIYNTDIAVGVGALIISSGLIGLAIYLVS